MKVNNIPKDLDVILRFTDGDVLLSDSLTYSTPILIVDKKTSFTSFMVECLSTDTSATFKICNFNVKDGEGVVTVQSTLEINVTEDGLVYKINSKPVTPRDLDTFLKMGQWQICNTVKKLSFNSHINRIGFKDIFTELRKSYSDYNGNSAMSEIIYYTYYSDPKMYAVAERLIKMGMTEAISKYNPFISKKEIPDASTIKPLSKISVKVLDDIKNRAYDPSGLLANMEANTNIGINGIKLIEEVYELYQKMHFSETARNYDLPESFSIGWHYKGDIYEGIYSIVEQFNIPVKVLLNRIIKASFAENLSPANFIKLATDYITMSKEMGLKLPEKMPKDIVKNHDLVVAQYEYVKNKLIEKNFKIRVNNNKSLLTKIPESKFFTIISPETPNDLIEEGLNMHHCVGTYINRYANGSSKIFFVRNKGSETIPFVTLELDNKNRLIQAKAYANSNPSKEVLDFINNWLINLE